MSLTCIDPAHTLSNFKLKALPCNTGLGVRNALDRRTAAFKLHGTLV